MSDSFPLTSINLFSRLSPATSATVAAALERRHAPEGELLFRLGDEGDELFIVLAGAVEIFAPTGSDPREGSAIRVFRAGDVLGEMALIDRRPRSVSARTAEPTDLLVLGGDRFRSLLGSDPSLAFAVMGGLSDRIRYTTEFLSQVRGWVHQISENRYDPAALARNEFGDETLEALAREFAEMAARVRQREEALKQEIVQLRIEIDESKKRQEVKSILDSDQFRALKAQARQLRERNSSDEDDA